MSSHSAEGSSQKAPPAEFYVRDALRSDATIAGETTEPTTGGVLRNPLVPLGMIATAGVLGRGLYHFFKGNTRLSQRYMRYRVAAQFVTVCALGFGAVYMGDARAREVFGNADAEESKKQQQQAKLHHRSTTKSSE